MLLKHEEARKSFVRMMLTIAETGMNSHGGAEVVYLYAGEKRRAYSVFGGNRCFKESEEPIRKKQKQSLPD